ncbi:SDR family oxidoreductase [Aeromicrobium chenweiae]|uniref:Short chain dehydrogenase n=1 Tax=Aeromicrobium chenweiae TaxID=2079793 RepID=A0A2S0WIH6_9ACTN|nr:SDR family oxidoreductase [Aeromicrobium chenweiae]AWB91138.1 short chain dehydrogenase [Aeromicrobium chenweiae]TGN31657.1 SDR family oxidoreductase [Aeromicrobium chenweiae]
MKKTAFAGRTAVITGAGGGIGRAAAVQAAAKGARLALTDVDAAGLEATVALVADHVVHHEAFDIADEDAVAAFAHRTLLHGPVDIVMNVAGISVGGRIQDLTSKDWRDVVEVDLMGPIHVLSAFVPPMIAAGNGGHVVNVSSSAGLFGLPVRAPYSAAKFGLHGVSEVLRFDLEQHGIGVTLLCPGAVRTPLVSRSVLAGVDPQHPAIQKMFADFERQAVSPEDAAAAMIRGVEGGRYLVFTSHDVRTAHYLQRYVPWAYQRAMRRLNRRFSRIMAQAETETAPYVWG